MNAEATDGFGDAVLAEAAARFGVRPGDLRRLDSFESFVYAVEEEGVPRRALRLTHSSHRSAGEIAAELDWVEHLGAHGVTVAAPLPSPAGERIESIAVEGGAFHATMFAWAPGARISDANADELWTEALFRVWGGALGRMHALASRWEPAPGCPRRRAWHEDDLLAPEGIPAGEDAARRALAELTSRARALPRGPARYGLVHHDAHPGNFFVDGDRIVLFDFDDAVYDHFAADVAIALYYALWRVPAGETKRGFAHRFLTAFLTGYRREHPALPPGALADLPLFLRLRDLTLYLALRTRFDPEALAPDVRAEVEPRLRRTIGELGERIAAGAPPVELELERLG